MSKSGASLDGGDWKISLLIAAGFLAVFVAIWFPSGGHFNVDEGVYHMMVRDFAGFRDFALWNGYEEFPSAELSFPVVRIHDGSLVSQYPEVFTLLAQPFYLLMGYDGLFAMNALAFAAVVWLTFRLALRLFESRKLALNACLILVFATYAWEYSQVAMPHALSALFVIGAVALVVAALEHPSAPRSYWLAALSGLVMGFGVGVRLDVAFVLPALVVPFLFLRPWRPLHILAVGAGTLPGLALLAYVNAAKFGVASPFTYGANMANETANIGPYVLVAVVGAAALVALRIATLPASARWLGQHRGLAVLGTLAALGAVLAIPHGWALASRFAGGLYLLLVDLRIRDLTIHEGGLLRGTDGAMIYIGAVKKSLLQSSPYLAALAVPMAALLGDKKNAPALGSLFLVPVGYLVVYSYFAWHGGASLNLRYFVPALPFLAILTAYAWSVIAQELPVPWRRRLTVMGAVLAVLFFVFLFPPSLPMDRQAFFFLTLPLGLACGLLVLVAIHLWGGPRQRRAVRGPAVAVLTLGLVWSGLVAFGYDLPRSYMLRKNYSETYRAVARHFEPESVLFAYSVDPFFGLLEQEQVRLAQPPFDNFNDFEALARFHLDAGRPIYIWSTPTWEREMAARGFAGRLQTVLLWEKDGERLERLTGVADDRSAGHDRKVLLTRPR